jgi:hypothetical protein
MSDALPAPKPPDAELQLQLHVRAVPTSPPPPPPPEPRPRAPWLTPVTAPILVALLATIAPVTAAVNAHYQAALQLELDRQKQTDERTRLYLERAISQDAGAESRVQVLRFLQIQGGDPDLRVWAGQELDGLHVEVASLREQETALVTEVAQAQQKVDDLSREQEELVARLDGDPVKDTPQLRLRLDAVQRDLEQQRVAEATKAARLSQVASRLHGDPSAVATPALGLCARSAYFNPVERADFKLATPARLERARACDRSLSAGAPPSDATLAGAQWRWQLGDGTTCGCQARR